MMRRRSSTEHVVDGYKGFTFPGERLHRHDERTGIRECQVTNRAAIHHHPFYYIPAYDDAMRSLFFASSFTGVMQIYREDLATNEIVQLTDCANLNDWSMHPSHDGRFVYFTAGRQARRVDTTTLGEETLMEFSTTSVLASGMVGAGMGTTTLSRDDQWWAVPVRYDDVARLHIIDTINGVNDVVLETSSIGHPQFHPDNSGLLRYAGPYDRRIWVVGRDGYNHRLVYERNKELKEWIVHESWIPGTNKILAVNWPREIFMIDVDTRERHTIANFNAWHPSISRCGRFIVTDTTFPDRGMQIVGLRPGSTPTVLCFPESSNAGEHWNCDHCPYDDGRVDVYAPQHTHPHPSISPDGRKVIYTSDRSGWAQLYEVDLSTVDVLDGIFEPPRSNKCNV